jgi:GNAT superfamily N-acetyltransferase
VEYETAVRLDDGRRVFIRPILPSDAPELAEAIRTADAETLHARFLGGPPPITETVLHELTVLDYVNRFALVARAGRRNGHGVAVARYAVLPAVEGEGADGTLAEVAVAVDAKWRGAGLATRLVRMLASRAAECGISSFTAIFMAENRPVVELAHDLHARVVISEGAARLYAATDADAPEAQETAGQL